jgi:hypothetical protein
MSRGADIIKHCHFCGEAYSLKGVPPSNWSRSRYCGPECRENAFDALRSPGVPKLSPISTDNEVACREHLKLLVRYGLRHDGLPGLPGNDLILLAYDLGVAA